MLKPLSALLKMPRVLSSTALASVIAIAWLLVPNGQSQVAVPRTITLESITPLLTQLKKQQDDITANQTKIEAQTEALKEQLRQAKIYSARSR